MKKKSRLKSFFAILLAISMVFQQSSLTVLATDDTYAEDVTATPTPSESEAEEYTEEEAEPEAEEPVAEEPEEPQEEPETPAEEPAQEPTEAPAEQPTEAPAEQPTEAPAAEPTEAPATEVTEAPAAPEVTDTPAAEATATPVPEVSAVPSETPTPTPTEAPKTSFRYEDSRVVITAIAPEDANLPQNAEIKADYIAPGTDRYNAAVAAFNSQLSSQLGLNAKNTTAEYVLYDVYFLTADGKRIEPESGNVKVDMSFKQIQESTVDGDVVNKDVVHLDNEGQAEVVTEYINTNADGEITSMGFTQDSFSIVGGVTTYGAPSTGEENNSGKEAKLTDLVKAGGLTVSATSSVENVNRKGTLEFAFSYVIDDDKLDTAKNNPTWVYDISSLLSSAEGGVFSSIVEDSVGIIYDGNTNAGTYKVKNGKVYLYIDSSYIQNHTSDVKGTFLLNCSFDSSVIKTDSEKEIEFPGITDKTVVKFEEVKTETSKKVQGQQADDGRVVWSADGKLNYEITFKANADLDKLVLTDTLGAGQEIVGGKIKINDNIEVPVTVKNGVFTVDVKAALGKEIKAGDYYKVTYQTTVENTGWNSEITNKASWNWEGTKNTPEDETKITVKRDVTQKTVTKSETTKEDGTKDTVFTYTITVGDGVTDLNGYRLIDKMSKNQKYVEGSFSVTPELPGLTPIPPTDFSSDDNQQHTFLNYTFSKSTTSKYTITYKTTTEGTDLSGWHNVKNDIETLPPGENDGNKDSTYESVDYGSKSKAEIEKKFEKFDPTNDGSYVWWTITVKVPTGTTLNNVRVQENDMGYSDKDGGPKSTDGYAIDASKVTVVKEKDGSSVEAYTYDASSRSFIFGSLSDNIIIKIPFIYEAGFATITGAGKWFYNKGTLYVDNWTYIGEDSAKARYLSTYDVTKSHGNYNKKTREVTWSVVINDLAKTYTPDKNVTFKDTIPDGMSYKEGSFNVKVNDGAETAIVPTVENNTISARLGGLSGNKYIVTYTTVVDSKFLNDSHTYTNCVKVYDEGEKELTGTEDSITINHTYIAKSSDGIKANDKLDYTITVNEEGLKLSDEATLTLIDELPEGVELMPNGIEGKTIFAADGENQPVNISYELVGRKLTITIPDEKHVVIKYRVRVSELGDQELINRVTLSGKVTKSTEDKKNVTVNSHGATISGSNDEFMFEKSNSDLSEKLSGATFKVYSVTYDKDTKKITGDPTLHCEVITDQNGQAKVTDIKAGVIYYWVETNPPAGYEISDPSKHYFIRYDDTTISKNTATALVSEIVAANEDISEIMITKGGITKTVTDRKVNLTISKIVTGGDASEYAESFKIKVTNTERINLENAIVSNVVENSVSISGSTIEFSIAGNSTVSIKDLPAGTYTVEEMNGANVVYQTSYKLDGKDVANAKFKLASASDGHSVEITNTYPEKGILILIKKGVGEMALAGAEFELYKTGNPETLIGTYTTGEDGKITVDGVEPGSYYFKETKAPAGYVTPSGDAAKTGVKEVAAGQTEVKTYTFEMSNTEESKGKLELLKTGAEGAALEGAKFDLYKVGNPDEKRGSYVTGKDGKITVDDVEPGSYYFVETEAPAGYVTPAGTAAKTETVVVEAGQASVVLYTINVSNTKENEGKLKLVKTGTDGKKLAGAEFDLYRVEDGKADTRINKVPLVTDENGTIEISVDPGSYYFEETKAPAGYVTPSGAAARTEIKTVEAGQTEVKTYTFEMSNTEESKGKLELVKTGAEGKALEGAKFDLYKVGNPDENCGSYVTDKNGKITVDNVEPGSYYFVETEAPAGYVTPAGTAAKTETVVVEAGQASVVLYTINVSNTKENEGKLKLVKTGTDGKKLAGAEFDLYRVEDGKADTKINKVPLVTDENGIIEISVDPGSYYFEETKAPAGYVTPSRDAAKTEIKTVEAGQNEVKLYIFEMSNIEESKGKLELVKTGAEGKALEGAKFDLYKVGNPDENRGSYVTDKNGKITVDNVEPGSYYFVETEAPSGYVTPSGEAAKTETKTVKAGQKEKLTYTFEKSNTEESKGKLELLKTGAEGAALEGAKFDLYKVGNPDENRGSYVTDKDGKITVDNVEPGSYYFVETEAPSGYVTPSGEAARTETKTVKAGQKEKLTYTFEKSNTEESKGKLELLKTGAEGIALEGAKFDLYKVGNPDENRGFYVTGKDGKITVDNVEPGSYYFVETEAPAGYVTPAGTAAKTETVVVEAGQASVVLYTINVSNTKENEGKLKLVKTGTDGKKLAGAEFDLYRVEDGKADTRINKVPLVTDENGTIEISVDPGSYYFEETKAPAGYVTPSGAAARTEIKTVEAGQTEVKTYTFEMSNTEESKGKLELVKTGAEGKALEGAKFDLYKVGNPDENRGSYVTGQDGKITVDNVEPGSYYFVETEAPSGYVTPGGEAAKTETKTVKAGQKEKLTYTFEKSNTEESKGKLELLKTGAEGAALEGAKFDLYKVGNPDEKRGSYVTGKDGKITVDDVESGSYYFVETEAPSGYVTPGGEAARTETKTVKAGQKEKLTYTFEKSNTEESKGKLELLKTGAEGAALEGAKFDLYKVGDPDEKRGSYVTGEDGKITVDNVEPGSYYFVETEAPSGYVTPVGTDAKTETVVVKAGQAFVVTYTTNVSNTEENEGKLKLEKTGTDGKKLAGAEFDLYRAEEGKADTKINEVSLVTDENGIIEISVDPGSYYFVETKAPTGYVTPSGDAAKTQVKEVLAKQAEVKVYEVSMTNTPTKATITKVDALGNQLSGVVLEIQDKDGNPIETWTTDGTPHVIIGKLILGETYTLVEKSAPKGYALAKSVEFTVSADDTDNVVTMENTYSASGSLNLTAKKTLTTTETSLAAGQFTFELRDKDGNVLQSKTNDADGNVIFDAIEYNLVKDAAYKDDTDKKVDAIGDYLYTVNEVKGDAAGYTYDNTIYTINVTVEDAGNGTLTVTPVIHSSKSTSEDATVAGMEFTNTYKTSGQIVLSATKTLEGQTLEADQFSFQATEIDADGNAVENGYNETVKNADGGAITFPIITYEKSGSYYYQITEVKDEKPAYQYDESKYVVKVDVTDDNAGKLTAKVTAVTKNGEPVENGKPVENGEPEEESSFAKAVAFTNTYSASADLELKAQKSMKVEGEELGTFEFELKDADGNVIETVKNDENGAINFSKLSYDEKAVGQTFTYTVNEKIPSEADIYVYDNTVYTVTVEVEDNRDGTLKLTTKVNGEDYTEEAIKFVNDTTKVTISKVDDTSLKALSGAKLQVVDADDKVVEEWVSDGTPHVITAKLVLGATYKLVEAEAPLGYEIAEPITFTVDADDTKNAVEMKDAMTKSETAAIEITKELKLNDALAGAKDMTFYVALFADEECTILASDVKALEFKNASSSTVTFTGVDLGRTYYVSETDEAGKAVESGMTPDGKVYIPVYPQGKEITVTEDGAKSSITFENQFNEWPDGFYKIANLNVTKELLGADGNALESDGVFYAGIFDDKECTTLSTRTEKNILTLDLAGGSTVSESTQAVVMPGESFNLYVAETDAEGNLVAGTEGFKYVVTVKDGNVYFDENNLNAKVTIINQEQPEATPTVTPEETPTPTPSSSTGVKTGDDTPIGFYMAMLFLAALAIEETTRRRRKKEQD